MSNRILVIGPTGTVGHSLVEQLAARGQKVGAATRHPETYAGPAGVEVVRFDYDQPETYGPALQGVDRVFALPKNASNDADETLNSFIDAAKAAGVRHFALMTFRGVDMAPDSGFRKAELHLSDSGLPYTLLRPQWFMQNFNPGFILTMIRQMGGIYLPAGDGKISFVDTRDIAEVAAIVLTEDGHLGKAYGITGSEALDFGEAAAIVSAAAGRTIGYTSIPDQDFRNGLKAAGWTPGQVGMLTGLLDAVRAGLAAGIDSTTQDLTGRSPRSFADFVKENAYAWR
jgi:uncharacterized protein YbjT (DUF2867 family)